MKFLRRLWRWWINDWWEVRACEWPYPEGFAIYHRGRGMILDMGLTYEQAAKLCEQYNDK